METNSDILITALQQVAKTKAQRDLTGTWFKGSETYLDALSDEIAEVKSELDSNRQCFLEDELGDLLWDFVCLIEHLELEGKIIKKQVFRRALKKYSERVTFREEDETWESIKQKQKLELQQELDRQ